MKENMIKPYVILILMQNDKVLLLKRDKTGMHDGKWGFIAGKMQEGEFPSQAVMREAFEEVGITVEKNDLQFGGVLFERIGDDIPMAIAFLADKWSGDPINKESIKHSEMKFVTAVELPEEFVPAHMMALEMTVNELGLVEFLG